MLAFRRWFRGDTLIEVTIAIGIFALVAISVVAVVNISTSGAQSALENTLAREEVDSQVETLRFIQSAYVNDSNLDSAGADNESKLLLYKAIWEAVKENADDNMKTDGTGTAKEDFSREFKPETCDELYDEKDENEWNDLERHNAFIIDIRKLNDYDSEYGEKDVTEFAKQVVLPAREHKNLFSAAITYPRLVYKKDDAINDFYEEALINDGSYNVLDKVEGIYIVGVRDEKTTSVVTEDLIEEMAAYYDFYVRSCWYNAGSEVPSTVSTLVRLRDPDSIAYVEPSGGGPKPSDPCLDDTLVMQNWNGASSLSLYDTTSLCDNRDGTIYSVVKLKDGHVWLAQDFRLNFEKLSVDISKENTNNPTDDFMDWANGDPVSLSGNISLEWRVDDNNFRYYSGFLGNKNIIPYTGGYAGDHDIGVYTYDDIGVYYNFYAATAGNGDEWPDEYDVEGDICPIGWHIPTKSDFGNMAYVEGVTTSKWYPYYYTVQKLSEIPLDSPNPLNLLNYFYCGVGSSNYEYGPGRGFEQWLGTSKNSAWGVGGDDTGSSNKGLGNIIRCMTN